MDERLLFDTFSAITLFLVAVLGAWLPYRLSKSSPSENNQVHSWRSGKTWYHLGNCLSGGVMLSAGFCHLLAESLHGIAFVGRFPLAAFLTALGFLVTLVSDQMVQVLSDSPASCHLAHSHNLKRALSKRNSRNVELTDSRSPAARQGGAGEKVPLLDEPAKGGKLAPALPVSHGGGRSLARPHAQDGDADASDDEGHTLLTIGNGTAHNAAGSHASWGQTHHRQNGEAGSTGAQGQRDWQIQPTGSESGMSSSDDGAGHLDVLLSPGMKKLNFATALLLAAALCVHSILEGMALGAQRTMASTEDIMLAIAAHKGLAAYALGSSIVESGASPKRCLIVMLTFSLATPIAIFIGYGLSVVNSGMGGDVLSALAAGTFLYVAMMEVIPRELQSSHAVAGPTWMKVARITALMLGFGAMSLLAIWA